MVFVCIHMYNTTIFGTTFFLVVLLRLPLLAVNAPATKQGHCWAITLHGPPPVSKSSSPSTLWNCFCARWLAAGPCFAAIGVPSAFWCVSRSAAHICEPTEQNHGARRKVTNCGQCIDRMNVGLHHVAVHDLGESAKEQQFSLKGCLCFPVEISSSCDLQV